MKEKVELPGWLLLVVVGAIAVFVLAPVYTALAWNLFLTALGAPTITYLNALGLDMCLAPFLAYGLLTHLRSED